MSKKYLSCKCYLIISLVFYSSYFSFFFFVPRDSNARSEFFKSCFLILAPNAYFGLLKRLLCDYCVNHASGALRKYIAKINRNCACVNKMAIKQYLWTWRQSVVPNDAPRDFGPEVAFGAKFQIPVARQ